MAGNRQWQAVVRWPSGATLILGTRAKDQARAAAKVARLVDGLPSGATLTLTRLYYRRRPRRRPGSPVVPPPRVQVPGGHARLPGDPRGGPVICPGGIGRRAAALAGVAP